MRRHAQEESAYSHFVRTARRSANRTPVHSYVPSVPAQDVNQPRWWLVNPDSFGKERLPDWKKPRTDRPDDVVSLRAAMVHHACIVTVNDERRRRGKGWQEVAEDLHTVSYSQLRRVVTGQAHLSLRLLDDLSQQFGPVLVYSGRVRDVMDTTSPWPGFRTRD